MATELSFNLLYNNIQLLLLFLFLFFQQSREFETNFDQSMIKTDSYCLYRIHSSTFLLYAIRDYRIYGIINTYSTHVAVDSEPSCVTRSPVARTLHAPQTPEHCHSCLAISIHGNTSCL